MLASYFLYNIEGLPFQTTSEIAIKAGVSEPTVIRFIRLLGYKGFVQFKNEFQRVILEKFGPSERLWRVKKTNAKLEKIIEMQFEREVQK